MHPVYSTACSLSPAHYASCYVEYLYLGTGDRQDVKCNSSTLAGKACLKRLPYAYLIRIESRPCCSHYDSSKVCSIVWLLSLKACCPEWAIGEFVVMVSVAAGVEVGIDE